MDPIAPITVNSQGLTLDFLGGSPRTVVPTPSGTILFMAVGTGTYTLPVLPAAAKGTLEVWASIASVAIQTIASLHNGVREYQLGTTTSGGGNLFVSVDSSAGNLGTASGLPTPSMLGRILKLQFSWDAVAGNAYFRMGSVSQTVTLGAWSPFQPTTLRLGDNRVGDAAFTGTIYRSFVTTQ